MIREATIRDLDALVAGNRAMAEETEQLRLDEATLRAGVGAVLGGRVPAKYHVLEEDGVIAAQLMITHEWSDWRNCVIWWIQSVYVVPGARKRGLFRKLYLAVRDEAKKQRVGGIRLYVDQRNQRAQATYESLGMDGSHYRVFEEMWTPST